MTGPDHSRTGGKTPSRSGVGDGGRGVADDDAARGDDAFRSEVDDAGRGGGDGDVGRGGGDGDVGRGGGGGDAGHSAEADDASYSGVDAGRSDADETGRDEAGRDGAEGSNQDRANRRTYLLALAACLAGAGIAAYGATRPWSVEVTPRPEMSDLRVSRAGVDVAPWVIGLALVGLAGAGALLATYGRLRRALGVLLTLAGVGVAVSAIAGRAGLDTGDAGAGGTLWPIVCVIGGVIVALGGLTAARFGHQWPRMSARYERKPTTRTPPADANRPIDSRTAWDSLDRGDDPTV
ncbi:Trp biosynthesis-associated membrane protein [Paractinoplanes brasiliensis]|uniref:Putative membrane protein (TIGR02234 family) n=1 Tax=Paractinoplanes brasiliensis TaxID=52695 RepID=A0A4R6JMT8_9ACTN|nr:Trp biosynthesis-associated membrane protein [Actinoplanes brasiliensis]TDO37650.1 putative membrane protein (TIGR02234 family) [Actinoplanes brasiliensis]GID31780.1 hypothetical protein Abr02nite_67630 [Actinoplanes brasiliensis]